jgi:hypothetical protein
MEMDLLRREFINYPYILEDTIIKNYLMLKIENKKK